MPWKNFFRFLGNLILGLLVIFLLVSVLAVLVLCRHSLPPQSVAIVREVWSKEGALFGPTALPFRVRVLTNKTDRPLTFFIQPPPFGVIEEMMPLQAEFSFSFHFPLWQKDKITGNPNDGSIAYISTVTSSFKIGDFKKFARQLDPKAFQYQNETNPSPFLLSLTKSGRVIPSHRLDLLREIVYFDFSQALMTTLAEISQSIHFKIYLIQKALEPRRPTSLSEQKIQIWKYLERYPWYKLEPPAIGTIFQTDNQILEKLTEYLQKEATSDPTLEDLKLEIQEYFSQYITEHPESYSQELWEYVIEKGVTLPAPPSMEEIRSLTYVYVQNHPIILKNILSNKAYQDTLSEQYGVGILDTKIELSEDLASRYPNLLP